MQHTDPNFHRQTAPAACLFCCRKCGESEKYMRVFGKINIIGLDNGYGNIKTANGIFPASVTCCEAEPAHAQDVLVYDGKYYVIGAGHREFTLDAYTAEQNHLDRRN